MTAVAGPPPRRILLATDLGARCDRALDRAAALAAAWDAELLVVHALEQGDDFRRTELEQRLPSWRRPLDQARIVEDQIRQDLQPHVLRFAAVVEPGEPAAVILRVARDRACDLVITGMARDETLGRFRVGGTVERLLGRSDVPVLVVRERARAPYRHIVVAVDFSAGSRHALRKALQLFPQQRLTVFHAYHAPMASLAGDAGEFQQAYGKVAEDDTAAFLQTTGIDREHLARLELLVEPGSPRRLVHQYVRDRAVDLIVLGTHGHHPLREIFVGSTTREILASLPCDALVVRGADER